MRPVSATPKTDRLAAAIGKLVGKPECNGEVSNALHAAFDRKETPIEITVIVDLPGVDEDEISIEEISGLLQVSAEREFDHDLEDAEEYTHLERPYGRFQCAVPLADNADTNAMTAKYKRGVLKIKVPRKRV